MRHIRILTALIAFLFIILVGFGVSFIARGYRFDSKKLSIRPSGLFVVTSSPDGAQIIVNGELESATNATISLPPDTYDVELRLEGYLPWSKRIAIKKEEVTKIDTVLFPSTPSLSGLTSSGALRPTLSPDGTKVVFGVPASTDKANATKTGLWLMDLGNLPIGFSTDPRQITNLNPENATWSWSADSRRILINTPAAAYVIPTSGLTKENTLVNIKGTRLLGILKEWKEEDEDLHAQDMEKLPPAVQDILERKTASFLLSPDRNKVLYTASGSATLVEGLVPALPGSSTQQQDRIIKPGKTYTYDIKEDRNFLILDEAKGTDLGNWFLPEAIPSAQATKKLTWFPTSNHLILAEEGKITIMDYDGTNRQLVWSGPYEAPYAIPYPSANRLLLLTKLGAGNGNFPNLYSLSLK